jgi:hypothetical protein
VRVLRPGPERRQAYVPCNAIARQGRVTRSMDRPIRSIDTGAAGRWVGRRPTWLGRHQPRAERAHHPHTPSARHARPSHGPPPARHKWQLSRPPTYHASEAEEGARPGLASCALPRPAPRPRPRRDRPATPARRMSWPCLVLTLKPHLDLSTAATSLPAPRSHVSSLSRRDGRIGSATISICDRSLSRLERQPA